MKMNNHWFQEEPQQKFIQLEPDEIDVDTPCFRPLTSGDIWELIDLENDMIGKNEHTNYQPPAAKKKEEPQEVHDNQQDQYLEASFHPDGPVVEDQYSEATQARQPRDDNLKQEAKMENVSKAKVLQQIEEPESVDGEEIFFYSRKLDNSGSSVKIPNPIELHIKEEKAELKGEIKAEKEQQAQQQMRIQVVASAVGNLSLDTTLNLSSFQNPTISERPSSSLNWVVKSIERQRQKRYRTKPIKFWLGEKVKYIKNVAVEEIRKKEMKDYFLSGSNSLQGWKTIANTFTIFEGSFDLKASHSIDLNLLGLNGGTVILSIEPGKSLAWVESCLIVEDKKKGAKKIRIQQERILKVRSLSESQSTIVLKILAAQ